MVGLVSPELQAIYAATTCTVEEIVVSGLHSSIGLNAPTTPGERALARRALARVGMLGLRGRRARELSYGQLRLALLARAIVAPRRLLLLDEPFDGLDAATCATALRVIGDMAARRVQVVLATHHGEDVPDYVRNELAFGRSGRATRTLAGVSLEVAQSPVVVVDRAPHRRHGHVAACEPLRCRSPPRPQRRAGPLGGIRSSRRRTARMRA